MTPEQLIAWRGARSRLTVATLLGCHVNSIANWERRGGIPKYIHLAILAIDAGLK